MATAIIIRPSMALPRRKLPKLPSLIGSTTPVPSSNTNSTTSTTSTTGVRDWPRVSETLFVEVSDGQASQSAPERVNLNANCGTGSMGPVESRENVDPSRQTPEPRSTAAPRLLAIPKIPLRPSEGGSRSPEARPPENTVQKTKSTDADDRKTNIETTQGSKRILPSLRRLQTESATSPSSRATEKKDPLPLKISLNQPEEKPLISIKIRPRTLTLRVPVGGGSGSGGGDKEAAEPKRISIMATNPHMQKPVSDDNKGSFSLKLNPNLKATTTQYSYGQKRLAPEDTEPVELALMPIGSAWYLYCENNRCLYDTETQDKIGKIQKDQSIIWYDA